MHTVTLACQAMATRFELVLCGDDPAHLRAAGEEALREIQRLEAKLSLFQPTSEVAHLNARAAGQPVRVGAELFELLRRAAALSVETQGAFDVTVAPLMRCWGFVRGTGCLPDPQALAAARDCVGTDKVVLDGVAQTVRFTRPGVMIDLGSIGKGFALEQAAALLQENGVTRALLHGGTSTVCALGSPPDAGAWTVGIAHPAQAAAPLIPAPHQPADSAATPEIIATVPLLNESLSVSAVWGRSFEHAGRVFGHVLDPRTGGPTEGAALAAVVLPSATDTDALSTALLVAGQSGVRSLKESRPQARTLVVGRQRDGTGLVSCSEGIETIRQALESATGLRGSK
jgi:FAD:protein FMN transferase